MYISLQDVSQWYSDYAAKKLVPAADTPPPPSEIWPHAAATAFSAAPTSDINIHVFFKAIRVTFTKLSINVVFRSWINKTSGLVFRGGVTCSNTDTDINTCDMSSAGHNCQYKDRVWIRCFNDTGNSLSVIVLFFHYYSFYLVIQS